MEENVEFESLFGEKLDSITGGKVDISSNSGKKTRVEQEHEKKL